MSQSEEKRGTQTEKGECEKLIKSRGASTHCLGAVMGVVWSWLALSGPSVQTHLLLPSLSPPNTFLSQEKTPFLLQLEL